MNRRKLIKILSCILAVLIVGAGGVFFAAYQRLKNISPDILLDNDGELGSSKPKTYVTYKGERYYYNDNLVTLMLIGIDQSEAEGREGLGARSDTMVVCAVDVVENTIKMIVCPRDSKALIRHIDTDGNVYKEDYNKLNSSFPYGGGNQDRNKGAENVVYCVKRLLSCDGKYDIPLDKYGGINMDGVGPLNDAWAA
ncbi:MAG: LCP family protein [Christensenellales bacterium]